ncbi:hypothetical protein ACWCW7_07500 [Nocardia tengchongensis]
MTRLGLFQIARVVGQVAWWVFIAAVLLATATAAEPVNPSPADTSDCGTSESVVIASCVYVVVPRQSWASYAMTPYATAAFVLVLLVAVTEAVVAGRMVPGLITIAAPVASALIILNTLTRTRWWYGTPDAAQTAALIVIAIAIREVWVHHFAPNPAKDGVAR